MRGKGVIPVLVVLLALSYSFLPVTALRAGPTLTWQCGLKMDIHIENHDFWTTGVPGQIFIRLKLLETGTVEQFVNLTMRVMLHTERVHIAQSVIPSPWNEVGDEHHLTAQFNLTPEEVNHAGWDTYQAQYYYQVNQTVILEGGEELILYMDPRGPYPITISTYSFIVYWPFPVIILMMTIYWIGLFALRIFNRRYVGLEKDEELHS
ncbi:hypothetical protein EU546_00575 [Candidatus Thorarchaeota archaeon]|nr:MAG: hypothetical protein EU546_00575 [Candidatus Thorarchaeota archaeon]